MRLRDIELLHLVLATGSVSEAAGRLHMSQPNASKILKKIEQRVGFALFERVHGRLQATEEGQLLFNQVERTIHSIRQLDQLAGDVREMQGARLTIGGMPLLSRIWLPKFLSQFLSLHPNIKVSLHTRSSQKLIEWVAEGQIDVAVAMLTLDDPSVERNILMSVERVAAIPRDHPLAKKARIEPKDLDGVDYISLSASDHAREPLDRLFSKPKKIMTKGKLETRAIVPNERAECVLPAAAIQLADQGIGVSVIDHLTASEHLGTNLVFRPFKPQLKMDIWLLKPKMRPRSRLTDLFIETIQQAVERDRLSAAPNWLFKDTPTAGLK